jgi:membrane-bound serine protease (ClpP class)
VDESDPDFFADASVRVSWGAIVPIAVVLSAAVAGLAWQAAALRHRRSPTGREGMIGVRGRTEGPVGPGGGRVRIHGESWQATASQQLVADTPVRVAALDGLEVRVEPLDEHDPSGESERD